MEGRGKEEAEARGVPESGKSQQFTPSRPADWMFLQPAILDRMHDAVIITDLEGMITGCNRAAGHLFGFTADELTGQSIAMFYAEDERHIFYEQVLPSVMTNGEFRGEVRNRTSAGEYIYVHLSVALLRDGEGKPAGMVGFSVDVTSQKLGHLAVKRSDEMESRLWAQDVDNGFLHILRSAVELTDDAMMITEAGSAQGDQPKIIFINSAFERLTGYSATEVLGRTFHFLVGAKTDEAALARVREAQRAWKPVREELLHYRKDRSEFAVDASIVPVADDDGHYTHWFSIMRDTTEAYHKRKNGEASETRLRTLMEALPQLVWTADAEGRRDWVSETFADFVGAISTDCLGDGWIRFVHPDDRELALARLKAGREDPGICTAELRLRRKDGEYVWFLKQAAPRFAADGSVQKWIGTFTDISARKLIERTRLEEEMRLQLGLKVGRLSLADFNYFSNTVLLSADAAHLFGLGKIETTVTRSAIHATFHPDDVPELMQKIAACLDPRGSGYFDMDHRVVWPGGEVRWLRVRKQVFFDGEGPARHPVRAMLAAVDITETKLAEEKIRRSEKHFRDLAESLPQFVWVTDPAGKKIYTNRRYLDYTGAADCEAMNIEWSSFVHPDDRNAAMAAWNASLSNGMPYLQEYRLLRSDGEYRHFLARAVPVKDQAGKIERWLGSSIDVHERKLAEDALRRAEKLAVVSRMASSISHEINNPLAGLVNILYLMQGSPSLDDELRELLHGAHEQLARVTEVTTQSLLFHRQSAQAVALRLSETIDSLIALHRPIIEVKGIRVLRSDRRAPALVCMAGDIRQALAHILNNALEALPERGVLSIRVRGAFNWSRERARGVKITIADNGRGISRDNLPIIFDAFFTTKERNSTGLGLWITRDIIHRHSGSIRLKSSTRPGASGTVFQLFLPYRPNQ